MYVFSSLQPACNSVRSCNPTGHSRSICPSLLQHVGPSLSHINYVSCLSVLQNRCAFQHACTHPGDVPHTQLGAPCASTCVYDITVSCHAHAFLATYQWWCCLLLPSSWNLASTEFFVLLSPEVYQELWGSLRSRVTAIRVFTLCTLHPWRKHVIGILPRICYQWHCSFNLGSRPRHFMEHLEEHLALL